MPRLTQSLLAGAALLVGSAGVAMAYPATVTTSLNLRAGPSTGYAVLTAMPAGAQVNVHNCLSNGWCQLSFAGVTGYASGNYIAGAPRSSATVVVEPDTVFEPYYTYWDTYPPYWNNGFFYYYNGSRYLRTRRDRNWWEHHRRRFGGRFPIRHGAPPHFRRGGDHEHRGREINRNRPGPDRFEHRGERRPSRSEHRERRPERSVRPGGRGGPPPATHGRATGRFPHVEHAAPRGGGGRGHGREAPAPAPRGGGGGGGNTGQFPHR